MSVKYFIDTNIFVYCFDDRQPEKKNRSITIIGNALQTGDGMTSSQVMQEFFNVATHKFSVPLNREDSKTYLKKVLHPLCQVTSDIDLYLSALDILTMTGYAFYDSLILAGAIRGECSILYSEDFHHGHQVDRIRIINPFI